MDFGPNLASNLGAPDGPKPKCWRSCFGSWAQDGTSWPQTPPRSDFGPIFLRFLIIFGSILGSPLLVFLLIFDWLLCLFACLLLSCVVDCLLGFLVAWWFVVLVAWQMDPKFQARCRDGTKGSWILLYFATYRCILQDFLCFVIYC